MGHLNNVSTISKYPDLIINNKEIMCEHFNFTKTKYNFFCTIQISWSQNIQFLASIWTVQLTRVLHRCANIAKANKDLGHDLSFMRTDSDQLVYLSLNYLVEGYIRNNLSVSTQFHLTSEHYTTSTWNLLKQVFHQLLFWWIFWSSKASWRVHFPQISSYFNVKCA